MLVVIQSDRIGLFLNWAVYKARDNQTRKSQYPIGLAHITPKTKQITHLLSLILFNGSVL